ncbi:MAG TPA: DNA polymerase III subunit delta [Gemmatirosa sp.]
MPASASLPAASTGHKPLDTAIATETFAPVYYLYGDDDFRKDDAVRQLLAAAVDPSTRDFNLETVRGAEADAGALGSLLATPPMMAARRAVVLRDPGALKKDARAALDRYLERAAPDTVLLLVAPAGAKVDRALLARAGAAAFDFAPLREDRLLRWIAHHASTTLGARITPEAARLLQAAVGNDLPQLAAELDKLASYAQGRSPEALTIDEDAVTAIVGVRRGETLADLLDAVARQDARAAAGLVPHVLSLPKSSAVTAVMALATQTLALAWGEARRARGVSVATLAGNGPDGFMTLLKEVGNAYTGRPWGDAVRAWTATVDRWTAPALDRALEQLLQADIALKETGVSSDAQLLTTVVLGICALPQERGVPRG